MRWIFLVVAVAAAGCSNDPCAPFSGKSCIALEVVGAKSVSIDQIRVDASGSFVLTDQPSPSTPRSQPVSPPIALAIVPSTQNGDFTLEVRALRKGSVIGAATTSGTLTSGKTTHLTVDIEPPASLDMAGPVDLAHAVDLAGRDLAGVQCDPLSQAPCAPGDKCVVVSTPACAPAGSVTPGGLCSTDPTDQCARGSQCLFPGDLDPSNGVCEQFCGNDKDCTEEGVLIPSNVPHCLGSLSGTSVQLCTVPCNPVATQGPPFCPVGSGCNYGNTGSIPEYTFCDREGSGTDGQPCDSNFRCSIGFNCLAVNTSTRCRAMCRANTDSDCTGGYVCKPGVSPTNPLFGFCCPSSGC